jgi:hypothetical protein
MSRRKTTASIGDGKKGYEVGYGKPPTHTQYRPGQSGFPAGRRKGVRNLKTDVRRTLTMSVKVREGGRTRNDEGGLARQLPGADQAILAAYVAQFAAAAKTSATGGLPDDPASKPAARSGTKARK